MSENQPASRTTLMDIARETGLSHMTVQRALTGSPSVRPQTRDRVMEVANRLGYRPNASARAMRNGRFNHVGVVSSKELLRSNMTLELLDGIDDILSAEDMHLVLARLTDDELTGGDTVPRIISQSMIDGLIIKYDNHVPSAMISQLDHYRIPYVWVNVKRETDCVYPDDFAGAKEATERFIGLGHKRIAYADFSYDPSDEQEHYSGVDRAAGYEAAMKGAGLTPFTTRTQEDSLENRISRSKSIIEQVNPTAIIGYGESAIWPFHALSHRMNYSTETDVQLYTMDGKLPDYLGLSRTHSEVDQVEVGRQAAKVLMRKLNNGNESIPAIRVPLVYVEVKPLLPPPAP